ncbi:MAG: DUF2769 domain-containing protein, partial [Alphaproteobacteria bacterium]|nr:DUF2769 domain-containing protein [Alphaproteobacteria bacterium]
MQVEKNVENIRNCLCFNCPSYTRWCKNKNNVDDMCDDISIENIDHLEVMFCAFDKSECIKEHRGCLCDKCSVHKKYA